MPPKDHGVKRREAPDAVLFIAQLVSTEPLHNTEANMRRGSASDSDGAAGNEDRLLRRSQQSRRGSRLRHHFFSKTLPKHMSMSLAMLRSILVIYIATICCNDFTSAPMVNAASSNGIHCTTRAAFCTHNTLQATSSLRSGELGNVRPLSTSQVELGQHFRFNCKRSGNGRLPVVSFPSSSTSALGVTDKQSSPEETIDVKGHTTIENDGSLTLSFEGSEPPLLETDLHSISTHNLDVKSETSDKVARKQERAFLARVSVLFSIVVFSVLKMSPSGSWRYYLAGGICASTSHAITTPIDVVKVRYMLLLSG